MSDHPMPVLFIHYGDPHIRGSERVLLDLLGGLDRALVRPIVWCNQEPIAEAVRALRIETYHSYFEVYFDYRSRRFHVGQYLALAREARALIGRHGVRVLHSNSAEPCQWLAPVSRDFRLPLLAHLHARYLRRSRYVMLLDQATLVVGPSRHVIDALAGMPAARTQVIPNGIDLSRLRPRSEVGLRARLGISPAATVICAVGSLVPFKGQDVLIRAFGLLDRSADLHLLIAGDGLEMAGLRQLAAVLGLGGRVHFLGHRDDAGLVYAASDVFAYASRLEAFGLVLAEAGYFGLPVVATAVGGVSEVVEDGVTGLLVPVDDPPGFAAALARVIGDVGYRERLGHAGKERVERLFNSARMVENFHLAYERLDY